ncbi:MAG: EpsD family peptidyl-prolyl cis-trans isomerase [Azonexus sp.]|nr:EpsD family peptidyl-prolyl cis-trans isomerase [Azonexus sp.]
MKTITILVVAAFAVAACGDRPPEKKAATQVAVKVNSGEISVHQINYVLQRAPAMAPEQAEAAKRQVLEGLIDQELAVQQALEAKLERTPETMQAIENARREILARAYVEQAAGAKVKPSAAETKKYYDEHPDLFANRKIYRLEEVIFAAPPAVLANVKEQLGKGKPVAEIANGLKANGVQIAGGVSVKPAEQLPLDLLPKLAQAKDGQPMLLESPERTAIITVLASKLEPVNEVKAAPAIEGFLNNKQRSEQARTAMKQLREKAKIEYVGEFAAAKPAAPVAAAEAPAAPAEKPAASAKDAAINKGIAGLK